MAGRPSEFTQERADAICELIADGKSLRTICAQEGMPDRVTVFRWIEKYEAFRNQYVRAREAQADLLAEETVEIADDGRRDSYVDADGVERVDHDVIARARLRVDARKWFASKVAPKKYGDRVMNEHTGANGGPIETKDAGGFELARRIAFALASAAPDKES